MTVREVTPAVDTGALLAGAQFADAFRVDIEDRNLDARQAAERMMARQPRWAEALLSLLLMIFPHLALAPYMRGLDPILGLDEPTPEQPALAVRRLVAVLAAAFCPRTSGSALASPPEAQTPAHRESKEIT